MNKYIDKLTKESIRLLIAGMQFQPSKTVARAKVEPKENYFSFTSATREVLARAYKPDWATCRCGHV